LQKVAHPADLWWPLAHLREARGLTSTYFAPQLVSGYARELVVPLGLLLSLPLARRGDRSVSGCLALLALLFLLRCLLDPSNWVYYELPFVIALTAWEARTAPAPLLSLLAIAALLLVFNTISSLASLDVQYVAYLLITLPFVLVLIGPALGRSPRAARGAAARLATAG
jgi:hypothetical protein